MSGCMHNRWRVFLKLGHQTSLTKSGCLICILVVCFGCATGRALTQEETKEFAALETQASGLRGDIATTQSSITKEFKRYSVRSKSSRALLCGTKAETLKTGKVPLVYAKKKRVVFKPNGTSTRRGCQEMIIKVQP